MHTNDLTVSVQIFSFCSFCSLWLHVCADCQAAKAPRYPLCVPPGSLTIPLVCNNEVCLSGSKFRLVKVTRIW
ncbi:uncharacterized protein B0J16DRAFT_350472 [Fusarium flagelliforme]|uniref:uncharacterized protein n=1 Tax=Fusarium flagelliforme TaxID=2675880 RepID=UPI001E8D87DC|nr:uncharacterized protein B0J16DRAFT_350472 [Fusarium flagelliforme]KAH7173594.1 hypothetical protein B0J16DRAFT_350472 [Fusarium flagelliforme]